MLADSLLMIVAMALLASEFSREYYSGLLLSVMVAGLAYGGAGDYSAGFVFLAVLAGVGTILANKISGRSDRNPRQRAT